MDLNERVSILKQGVEIGQKNGAYTINDAYYAKQALDALAQGFSMKDAFEVLIKLVAKEQKEGVYSLKDAHILYTAIENYETSFVPPTPEPAPEPAPELAPEPAAEPSAEPAPTTVKGKSLADLAAERLAWKTDFPGISVKNIRSAISLVDRAQFIAKLFGEDFALYDKTISELNDLTTLDEAVQYVTGHFPDWNLSSDLVYSFMMAIRKKLG